MGELAARADAVQPGLGVLAGVLAELVVELTGQASSVVSFDQIERRVTERGRELLRLVVQHVLDVRAAAEPRLTGVTDVRGVTRSRVERGHTRTVVSEVGSVVVARNAYRAPGVVNLYPRDAVLNLPERRYSWAVQARVVGYAVETSFAQAAQWLAESTGVRVGKR